MLVRTPQELNAVYVRLRQAILDGWEWGYDSETYGPSIVKANGKDAPDPYRHRMAGCSFAIVDPDRARDPNAYLDWYIPVEHAADETGFTGLDRVLVMRFVKAVWSLSHRAWVHNLKYDAQILRNEGFDIGATDDCNDSQVAAWLAGWRLPGKGGLKLKPLAAKRGWPNCETWEDVARGRAANTITAVEIEPYASKDAALAIFVGARAMHKVEHFGMADHYRQLDMPLVETVRGMEAWGSGIDREKLAAQHARLLDEALSLSQRFEELTRCKVMVPVEVREPKPCATCGGAGAAAFAQSGFEDNLCPGDGKKTCKAGMLHHKNGNPVYHTVEKLVEREQGARIGNDRDVSRWLYDELGWWPTAGLERNGHGCYPTDAETLTLRSLDWGPRTPQAARSALEMRLRYQQVSKLTSTYTGPLRALADQYADGRLHTNYHLTGTDTQRFSSSGPNLQNLPARSEEGKLVRDALVARPGWVWLIADYSQVELRIVAHLSQDPVMVGLYKNGADIHARTMERVGCVRTDAKITNFSTIYRISGRALARKQMLATHTKRTKDEAQAQIDGFFAEFENVADYHERAVAYMRKHGYAATIGGYKRFLDPGVPPAGKCKRHEKNGCLNCWQHAVDNMAINTPVQGSAGEFIKRAMRDLHRKWRDSGDWGVNAMLVGQTHDELICEVRLEHVERFQAELVAVMEGVYPTFRVPLVAEAGTGATWLEAKG